MSRKKLIIIGLVILVVLWLLTNLSRSFIGASTTINLDQSAASTTTGQYGMSGSSFGFNSLGESSRIAPDIAPAPQAPAVESGRNVIQTASINLIVENVESSATDIDQIAKDAGGFVSSSSLGSYNSSKQITSGSLQVRIPQDKLNSFLETLKNEAIQVKNISTTSDDVTTQVRDLQAEVENLKQQETQLRTFFERTTNITQLLEVERELNRVRTQIDQKQGQLNYYERASALATVSINLALDESQLPSTPTDRFQPQAVWNAAVASLLGMLQDLAYLAIYLLVYAVVWVPILAGIVLFRKFRKQRVQK